MTNISRLIFHGFNIDYTHQGEGFILVTKSNRTSITDADLSLIRSIVNLPDYLIYKSHYHQVTIG